jgi:hypothetical protein
MRKILLSCIFISLSLWVEVGLGQGLENFNNYPETSHSYHNGTFAGQDGSTWTYNQCRGDSVITAPTPTLGKARTPTGEVYSGTIHGGCGTLSFDYKQVFSTDVALDVFVNGILITTVTTSGEEGVLKNSGYIAIYLLGDFILDFKQNSTTAGQCAIDNVIWTGNTDVFPEPTNYPTNFTATAGYFKVNLQWTDAMAGQVPASYLILASSTNNIHPPVDGIPVPDDPDLGDGTAALNVMQGVQSCLFTGLLSNALYYFSIYPYTNSGTFINYKTDGNVPTANATTLNGVIIFHHDFNDLTLFPMTTQNILGMNQSWAIDSTHGTSSSGCAKMSGYFSGTDIPNEDWLISPAMNFNHFKWEQFSFMSTYNYSGDPLSIKISNTYDGVGDPNDFTWTDLTAIWSMGAWAWTSSGDIDVSAVNGDSVYIAFKYTCDTINSSCWELDDVLVVGTSTVGLGENPVPDEFSMYPNPAQGFIHLLFTDTGEREITFISETGTMVFSCITFLSSQKIDLHFLSAGIYFVKVIDVLTSHVGYRKIIIL